LPLVGQQLPGPEQPHDLELFLQPLAAIPDVLAERLELDGVPADADAQAQAAAREDVDLRRLLGDERGLALRQDEDARDSSMRRVTAAQKPKRTNGSWKACR
jgi:hypothetical protein